MSRARHVGARSPDVREADPTSSELDAYLRADRSERQIVRDELDEAIRQQSRATGWLITLGFGPAALVAVLLALFIEGSRDLAIAFAALGTSVMGLRAWRASRRVRELERALEDPMDGS